MNRIAHAFLACLGSACAGVQPGPPGEPTLAQVLEDPEARVMWVGAHPDDESLMSPILARACIALKRPCLLFVMNRGDGGECLLPEGCHPDLGTVRAKELALVARAYGAQLHHHRYFNAPLPVSSFPRRDAIGKRWVAEGDPAERIEAAIVKFKPTVLLTFDPNHGFTGHPEHQLASRFATDAVRRAADRHRVANVYQGLNRYWPFLALGGGDPAHPTETFDTHVPCGAPGVTCLDVALGITHAHRTQRGDMGRIREFRPQLGLLYLKRVDPFDLAQAPLPLDPPSD